MILNSLSLSLSLLKTYGNLYKKLTMTTGEIPIGLYRTKFDEKKFENILSSKKCEKTLKTNYRLRVSVILNL